MKRGLGGLLLLVLLAFPALANDHPNLARGFDAGKAYELASDLESVDLFSGALHLAIPLGQRYPVSDRLAYGFTLRHHARPWDHYVESAGGIGTGTAELQDRSKPTFLANAGIGWSLQLGILLSPSSPDNDSAQWRYFGPAGSPETFTPVDGGIQFNTFPQHSLGGSRLRLDALGSWRTVEFPDGSKHSFEPHPTQTGSYRLRRMEDTTGHWVQVQYPAPVGTTHQWLISDSRGRSHTFTFSRAAAQAGYYQDFDGVLTEVDLAAFGGGRGRYQFTYAPQTQAILYSCPLDVHQGRVQAPILIELLLPGGDRYAMALSDYHLLTDTTQLCDSASAQLRGLTVPTRGRLEWDTRISNLPLPEGDRCRDFLGPAHRVVERRRVRADGTVEGRWSYARSLLNVRQHCRDANHPTPPRELAAKKPVTQETGDRLRIVEKPVTGYSKAR